MSEKTRFKIKYGEIEIELEGEAEKILSYYEKVFEWISTQQKPPVTKTLSKVDKKIKQDKKEPQRVSTGPKKPKWSPIIDTLVTEGFFKLPNRRNLNDVLTEFGRRGLPSSGKSARDGARTALVNRTKSGVLQRAKDETNAWSYWQAE